MYKHIIFLLFGYYDDEKGNFFSFPPSDNGKRVSFYVVALQLVAIVTISLMCINLYVSIRRDLIIHHQIFPPKSLSSPSV